MRRRIHHAFLLLVLPAAFIILIFSGKTQGANMDTAGCPFGDLCEVLDCRVDGGYKICFTKGFGLKLYKVVSNLDDRLEKISLNFSNPTRFNVTFLNNFPNSNELGKRVIDACTTIANSCGDNQGLFHFQVYYTYTGSELGPDWSDSGTFPQWNIPFDGGEGEPAFFNCGCLRPKQ